MKNVKITRYTSDNSEIESVNLVKAKVEKMWPNASSVKDKVSWLALYNSVLECILSRKANAQIAKEMERRWKNKTDASVARETRW